MNRIIGAEDAARRLRERVRGRLGPPTTRELLDPRELLDLADAVAQGFQAIREVLDNA
jgi:hypothetical protein